MMTMRELYLRLERYIEDGQGELPVIMNSPELWVVRDVFVYEPRSVEGKPWREGPALILDPNGEPI